MYYDVIIVGGSLGGAAAALSASSGSNSVCLFEASGWIGGQYSAQGVTKPDENHYIETVGSTASYRNFRHAVRAFYRNNYRLSAQGAKQPTLNPGGPYPGFSTEPHAASNALKIRLQARPNVHVRLDTQVTAVDVQGDVVQSITAVGPDGTPTVYTAKYFLDATDLGDLLPMAGV
ncbi:MAG: FAD-dependent oxidoreductase, partial [Candidatus Eremiobacteraeota bacterium]|nr:FAD-dependent oxidoreductase [Candidatus Eremiobacteraeota bacterium]